MGILSAMFSGVSGLQVHGKALSSVADNIANVNTYGYKYTRANFADIMVQSLTVGGTVVSQVGAGARVATVENILTQGSFETTDVPTDLAINGAGYFQVEDVNNGGHYYTRAGQFTMDQEGYLVTPLGYRLQGYNVDSDGNILAIPEALQILVQQTDARATTNVDISVNLDAEDEDRHNYTEPIDPDDQDTWNYLTTTRTYDSLGVSHDLSMFYQRLNLEGDTGAYPGNLPDDPDTGLPADPSTVSVWKVSVFENDDGTFTDDDIDTYNTFYLVFDSDGHMIGSTGGSAATGDEYVSDAALSAATDEVSNVLGETLIYSPTNAEGTVDDPPGTQTFIGTYAIDFGSATSGDEVVTIGTVEYNLSGGTAAASAQELCNLINAEAGTEYWATVSGTTVTLYSSGTSREISITDPDSSATITTDTESLVNVRDAINNGRDATTGMWIGDVTAFAAGTDLFTITLPDSTVTTITVPVGGYANWAAMVADINGQLPADITASYVEDPNTPNQGTIFLTADGTSLAGSEGNDIVIARDSALTDTELVLHGTNFYGGMDDRVTSNVEADIETDANGEHLVIRSIETGDDAAVSIASASTLGSSLSLNFQTWEQTLYANDGQPSGSPNNAGEWDLTFNWLGSTGATEPQVITFDFSPNDSATAASTQSAGASETYYLYQDGSTRGSLQSLDISNEGVITGQFSNAQLRVLGQLLLADFANPNALRREGDNLWSQTINSGEAVLNTPGQGGTGDVESGVLEQSNVDMAGEFVKMINYQRAFQANSKIISTTDTMLAELIQLKR